VQASFTPPELQELGELQGADVEVDPADLELDAGSEKALEEDRERVRRNVELLREFAARPPTGQPKTIRLRFLVSPVAILGADRVEAVEIVRNRLEPDGRGGLAAVSTDVRETIPCGVVFRSVGYRGIALGGLPFDERSGTMPNEGGRVLDGDGRPIEGLYCAGWIKRGPSGVIGTNKKDATETVELLLEDAREGRLPRASGGRLEDLLAERAVEPVVYAGWEAIDAHERARGSEYGRPRVKLVTWAELLECATAAEAAAAD
jgi:ferredoxin--NADP+ reductase